MGTGLAPLGGGGLGGFGVGVGFGTALGLAGVGVWSRLPVVGVVGLSGAFGLRAGVAPEGVCGLALGEGWSAAAGAAELAFGKALGGSEGAVAGVIAGELTEEGVGAVSAEVEPESAKAWATGKKDVINPRMITKTPLSFCRSFVLFFMALTINLQSLFRFYNRGVF